MKNTINAKTIEKVAARTAWGLTLFLYWFVLSACNQAEYKVAKKTSPTGVPTLDKQQAKDPLVGPKPRDKGYITPDRINNDGTGTSIDQNDEVQITKIGDPLGPKQDCVWVQVVVTKSEHPENINKKGKFCLEYLNSKPVKVRNKFFMIQNIATEKLRVYERCTNPGCPHRLVLEIDMVAGHNKRETQSALGVYWISEWHKFYQDVNEQNPPWYSETLPMIPKPGASFDDWMAKSLLPAGKGKARGTFGWYTAHIEPEAYEQWTHGYIGWGADGSKFIDYARLNDAPNRVLRSEGCTRVENRAIALIRDLMPEGALLVKVYAREAMKTSVRPAQGDYNWKITKNERETLEEGVYKVNQTPSAIDAKDPRNNLYGIDSREFGGVFYTDIGRLEGYKHPASLRIGGHDDRRLPGHLVISNQ